MSRTTAFLLLFLLFFFLKSAGQPPAVQVDGVEDFSFTNLQVHTDSSGVKGYVCYYEVKDKKVDGKKYEVRTYEKNLAETNTWSFICGDNENLLSVAYNGSHLMRVLLNPKKRILYHKLYDIASKTETPFEEKLDVNSEYYLENHLPADVNLPGGEKILHTTGDGDFVSLIPTKHNNVFTYDVNIFPKSKSYQRVLYTPETNFKTQQAVFVGSTGDMLLYYVFQKKDLTNNKYEAILLGVNTATGQQQFSVSTRKEDFSCLPLKVAYRQGQDDFTILGNYYNENGKMKRAKSKGLCLLRMNRQGEITARTTLNWKETFGMKEPEPDEDEDESENDAKKDTAAKEIRRFQVHAFGQTDDGSLFVAGEGFKYRVEGVKLAARILIGVAGNPLQQLVASGIQNNPFVVTDVVLVHADNNLNIDSVFHLPKKQHHATEFDTDFGMTLPARNQFVMAYRDYDLGKVKEEFSEKLLTYSDEKATLLQSDILTKAINYKVYPLSEKAVLLAEYWARKNQLLLMVKPIQP